MRQAHCAVILSTKFLSLGIVFFYVTNIVAWNLLSIKSTFLSLKFHQFYNTVFVL